MKMNVKVLWIQFALVRPLYHGQPQGRPYLYPLRPPLTSMRCPFIHLASSVQRNATTPPISSAWPTRPSGVNELKRFLISGLLLITALLKSVSIGPGATTLARIPLAPSSLATYLVNTSIAPFIDA